MIVERVHSFGADGSMVGIVTLPPDSELEASRRRPFIVLLNAGLVHRVGPFRMSVEIARSLAHQGFRVLRFDQTGLGDSPQRATRIPIEEQVIADGRAAMDFLETQYGARAFAIGGLCSGAMNAHTIGLADERVVALWLLDGYAYPTTLYYTERVVRGIKRPPSELGKSVLSKLRSRLTTKPAPEEVKGDDRAAIFFQDWPPIADARAQLERILRRGVQMLYVYTGGWSNFVDVRQFDQMFPGLEHRRQVRVAYYPNADHTYLSLDDRDELVREISGFVNSLPAVTR